MTDHDSHTILVGVAAVLPTAAAFVQLWDARVPAPPTWSDSESAAQPLLIGQGGQ